MVFKNGVKNIQTTAYNGARTVCDFSIFKIQSEVVNISAVKGHGIVFSNEIKKWQLDGSFLAAQQGWTTTARNDVILLTLLGKILNKTTYSRSE